MGIQHPKNYNKIIFSGTTLIDLTEDTVSPESILIGYTAHNAAGKSIEGTMPDNGSVSKTLDVNNLSYTIPKGNHDGTGKVNIVAEIKPATPTEKEQEITPTAGRVLSKVKVAPIPSKYKDVSGVTATADKVLDGAVFVDSTGAAVEGTMVNQGAKKLTIDGLTTLSATIPAGYHNGTGTVSLTDDIRAALAAI